MRSPPGARARTIISTTELLPSSSYPVARFKVPGGSFTFNAFHEGYIAIVCNVDNPRVSSNTPALQLWNQLQVTYTDPDGLQKLNGFGTEYKPTWNS